MSSLNESDEHTSPPATPGSLGVHVASSHFSNTSASSGNNGCLQHSINIHMLRSKTISITAIVLMQPDTHLHETVLADDSNAAFEFLLALLR